METGRGRRGKKAWQLTMGLKELIFAAFGMAGLLMMSFTLGVLSGRGDIYRAAYSLGLLAPKANQAAQIIPPLAPPLAPIAAATAPAATPAANPPSPAALKVAAPAAAKQSQPGPVIGAVVPPSPPAATTSAKKRAAKAHLAQEQKAREEQLRQHEALAKKLTFLNSFDTPARPGQKKTAAKSTSTLVKVATYRDRKTAQAKVAELQKKGVSATLKQGHDHQGAYYTVYRQAASPKEPERLAQGKEKEKRDSTPSSSKSKN